MQRDRRPALSKVWLRAVTASILHLTAFVALAALAAGIEGIGYEGLSRIVLFVDVMTIFPAIIIGPAWVLQPRTRVSDDGPPRGGLVPFPVLVVDSSADTVVEDRPAAA